MNDQIVLMVISAILLIALIAVSVMYFTKKDNLKKKMSFSSSSSGAIFPNLDFIRPKFIQILQKYPNMAKAFDESPPEAMDEFIKININLIITGTQSVCLPGPSGGANNLVPPAILTFMGKYQKIANAMSQPSDAMSQAPDITSDLYCIIFKNLKISY